MSTYRGPRPTTWTRKVETCPRCGMRRQVNESRRNASGLCRDCWEIEPIWPDGLKKTRARKEVA